MSEPTEHLRALARRIVDEALERVPLRAALLAGSAGRGDADFYSDIDLLLYVDELPPKEVPAEILEAVGGTDPVAKDEDAGHFCGEEFDLQGVHTEVSFVALPWSESRLGELLERIEEFDSPYQKVLAGILEGLPLHGEELVERRRARVRTYPEPLRRAMIERRWNFFPLWYYGDYMAARDAELWRLDMLLEAAFNLLAVLAALNRLYSTRFELKQMRALVAKMELAPPRLADRLESLFRVEPDAAATDLERLVEETRALVAAELPDLELPLRFAPGTRAGALVDPGKSGRCRIPLRSRFGSCVPTNNGSSVRCA
ncbi:MAG: nucleotidyltransferase domain-containing protein [Gaiellaceae bacterium]